MKRKMQRLDKYLANVGISSRKDVKKILSDSIVTVNGVQVLKPDIHIDPLTDDIAINGVKIEENTYVYFIVNKPKGIISSTVDEHGSESILTLVPTYRDIYPVGRLDKETTGLVLLTNDGELTHKLIHPKYHVPKVYILTINGKVTPDQLKTLRQGVALKDGITSPAEVTILDESNEHSQLRVMLHEGRNRQIRRMCEKVRVELLELERIQFGPLEIGSLPHGESRELTKKEITALYEAVKK